MNELLATLGNPLQARAVPEIIERIARGQVLLLHEILRQRMQWVEHSIVISYFVGDRKDSYGLPVYAIIAEGSGLAGEVPSILKTRFLQPLLNRYGGRAEVGYVKEQDGMLTYQWGMWLEDDLMKRFAAQQLPLFDSHDFDGFVEYKIKTKEPVYATQYALLREKGEASGALVYLRPISEYEALICFPAARYHGEMQRLPEQLRFEYVVALFAQWNPIDLAYEREVQGPDAAELLERVGKPKFTLAPASPVFVQTMYAAARRERLMGQELPLTFSEVYAVLGKPHSVLKEKESLELDAPKVYRYAFKIKDALVVVEAREDRTSIYYFPGEERTAILFEEFCRILAG